MLIQEKKLNDQMKFVHSLSLILLTYYKFISWLRSLQRYYKLKRKKMQHGRNSFKIKEKHRKNRNKIDIILNRSLSLPWKCFQ